METSTVKKVAVIGAGNMGNQIAELLSRLGGYEVVLIDMNEQLVADGLKAIDERMERFLVAKGKISSDEKKIFLERIKGGTDITSSVTDIEFAIEVATENLKVKKDIFRTIDENAPTHAILATNTSFQNISDIASATERPQNVVGMHFFNPVSLMRLVEVVKSPRTSDDVVTFACELATQLGKNPVVCSDASYGFLANRAYCAMQREAIDMVYERVATPEDIDNALKLGYNLPIGPLELGDAINAWTIWAASEQDAIREMGPESGRLQPLLRMMLRAGYTRIYDFWKDVLSKG